MSTSLRVSRLLCIILSLALAATTIETTVALRVPAPAPPDCSSINAAFPIDMDGTVCHGLYYMPSATNYDACAQTCCARIGCEVFQFCPQNGGCGAANACWMGGNDYCTHNNPGWQSRARSEPPSSHIWPLPHSYDFSSTFADFYINPSNFSMQSNSELSIVTNAMARYMALTFMHAPESSNFPLKSHILGKLQITIENPSNAELKLDMDESYVLNIPDPSNPSSILLTSVSIFGALRGLETFSQLVIFNFTERYYNAFGAVIQDSPRFSHRGLLIDTSRHFQSVRSIKNVLNAMAYAKLNVLHWHVTDQQSFPFESLTYPYLWNGSYTKYERYAQTDVKEIVSFARDRGIRVIPEFDVPGHAQSWCVGYPQICPSPSCQTPLNPAANATWTLLTAFIAEIAALFPDEMLHLGGDEVNTNCWTQTASIQQWMTDQRYTAKQALQYFDSTAISLGVQNQKQVIQWDEVFTLFGGDGNGLNPRDSIVQVWHSTPSLMPSVVKAGFRGIMSPSPAWYLPHLATNWETEYMLEPYTGITDPAQQKLVIGGEGCMWGETVDVSDIEQTIWPRMAAIAERLWSARNINSTIFALPRISYFRCLLTERNVAAPLINAANARAPPPQPGSCYALYDRR